MVFPKPVCVTNNHLASLYNLMAEDSNRAPFLTGQDLQLFAGLITMYYNDDPQYESSNFLVNNGYMGRCGPLFCAVSFLPENREAQGEFIFSEEYKKKYRSLYKKCLKRAGYLVSKLKTAGDDRAWIQFSERLEGEKVRQTQRSDELEIVQMYSRSAMDEILSATDGNFSMLREGVGKYGLSIEERKVGMQKAEMKEWFDSQFYILRDIPKAERTQLLDEMLSLFVEYFKFGAPYLLIDLQAVKEDGIRLNFGKKEVERMRRAIESAIADFVRITPRVKLNIDNFENLNNLMGEESSSYS